MLQNRRICLQPSHRCCTHVLPTVFSLHATLFSQCTTVLSQYDTVFSQSTTLLSQYDAVFSGRTCIMEMERYSILVLCYGTHLSWYTTVLSPSTSLIHHYTTLFLPSYVTGWTADACHVDCMGLCSVTGTPEQDLHSDCGMKSVLEPGYTYVFKHHGGGLHFLYLLFHFMHMPPIQVMYSSRSPATPSTAYFPSKTKTSLKKPRSGYCFIRTPSLARRLLFHLPQVTHATTHVLPAPSLMRSAFRR